MAAEGTDQRGLKRRDRSPTPDGEHGDWRDDYEDAEQARIERKIFEDAKRRLKSAATPPEFEEGFTLADFWKGWEWFISHIKTVTNDRKPDYLDDASWHVSAAFMNHHGFLPDSFVKLSESNLIALVRDWNQNGSPLRQLKIGVILHVHHVAKKWLCTGGIEEMLEGIQNVLGELQECIGQIDMSPVEQKLDEINETLEWAGNKLN